MKDCSQRLFITALSCFLLFAISACSSKGDIKNGETETVESIYKRAKSNMDVGDFETAISVFEQLESSYPFSKYAAQAQLDLIFAYYKFGEKYSAISQADRFMRFNPSHASIDYALYMKGVVQQDDRRGLFDKWSKPKREDYDISSLKESYTSFNELLQRFPDSAYAADARQRMIYIRNTIATSEWQIADFYLSRFQYVAAVNRAKGVIQSFPKIPAARKALLTLQDAYKALDMHDLAAKVQSIIEAN